MFNQRPKVDYIERFRIIRSIYDKIFITFAGSLWILSTLWDIYKLQRFWLDYAIEFYSSFIIFYMIIFSINPKYLPTIVYNSLKMITTITGRGTLLLLISSLFLNDKHVFHKFCSILLFIGAIIYYICEILVRTTKEELDQIESIYNKKDNNNKNLSVNNSQIINDNSNSNFNPNLSTELFKNNNENNNIINNNETNKNYDKQVDEKDNSNSYSIEKEKNVEKLDNEGESENNTNNSINNKDKEANNFGQIIRKTDNPYEIPEDF